MKKVLLTSAYKLFLKRNSLLLMRRGVQIITTLSGCEALKLHKEHNFDLILADFRLEDMSGCTLCSLIREDENSQRVPIILTCHNLPGSIERVENSCASVMLVKPIEPIKLLETISGYFDLAVGRSKRAELRVCVLSKTRNLLFNCFSHDISNTGILLETDQFLEVKSRIICEFTLPDTALIVTEGEVMRYMEVAGCDNLYGVKFVALPLSCRRAIDNFIISIPISGPSVAATSEVSRVQLPVQLPGQKDTQQIHFH